MLRVAELVRHVMADILSRGMISDPVLERHVVSVPEVRMSPDLKLATISVMPLGGNDAEAVVKALDGHKKTLRSELAHRVNLRYAPDIRFRLDDSFEKSSRIDQLLASPSVRRDLESGGDADHAEAAGHDDRRGEPE